MEITNTSEIEEEGMISLICGPSGAGKTYALGTLPENETLIISNESGLLSLKGRSIDVWKVSSVEDLTEAYRKLKEGTDYNYVCIDSLTEISDMCFASLEPNYTKQQNFDLYKEFSKRMTSIIKAFRDLKHYKVFMTTLLKDTEDGFIIDVAQKSLGYKIPCYFDFVWLVKSFKKDDKTVRALVSDNTVLSFLKARSNKIEEYEKVNLTDIVKRVMS